MSFYPSTSTWTATDPLSSTALISGYDLLSSRQNSSTSPIRMTQEDSLLVESSCSDYSEISPPFLRVSDFDTTEEFKFRGQIQCNGSSRSTSPDFSFFLQDCIEESAKFKCGTPFVPSRRHSTRQSFENATPLSFCSSVENSSPDNAACFPHFDQLDAIPVGSHSFCTPEDSQYQRFDNSDDQESMHKLAYPVPAEDYIYIVKPAQRQYDQFQQHFEQQRLLQHGHKDWLQQQEHVWRQQQRTPYVQCQQEQEWMLRQTQQQLRQLYTQPDDRIEQNVQQLRKQLKQHDDRYRHPLQQQRQPLYHSQQQQLMQKLIQQHINSERVHQEQFSTSGCYGTCFARSMDGGRKRKNSDRIHGDEDGDVAKSNSKRIFIGCNNTRNQSLISRRPACNSVDESMVPVTISIKHPVVLETSRKHRIPRAIRSRTRGAVDTKTLLAARETASASAAAVAAAALGAAATAVVGQPLKIVPARRTVETTHTSAEAKIGTRETPAAGMERTLVTTRRLAAGAAAGSPGSTNLVSTSAKVPESPDFPHTCNICYSRFCSLDSLRSHMICHSGAGPHVCSLCSRSFRHRTTLKHHELTHTGIRQFVCPVCSKSFTLKYNMTRHFRLMH